MRTDQRLLFSFNFDFTSNLTSIFELIVKMIILVIKYQDSKFIIKKT